MKSPPAPKLIGIASDHGGYELKEYLAGMLRGTGHDVIEFGDRQPKTDDDYPDFVVPLARAVARGYVDRGVAICGSGSGKHAMTPEETMKTAPVIACRRWVRAKR